MRLRSVTRGLPKPLIDVVGSPFLNYLLDEWIQTGLVSEFIFVVRYRSADFICAYGTEYKGIPISHVEEHIEGTAPALIAACRNIRSEFIICNGDTYWSPSLISSWLGKASLLASATIFAREGVFSRGSLIEVSGKGKENLSFVRYNYTPSSDAFGLQDIGVKFITNSLCDYLLQFDSKEWADLTLEELCVYSTSCFPISISIYDGIFIDIGIPEDYRMFCSYIRNKQ